MPQPATAIGLFSLTCIFSLPTSHFHLSMVILWKTGLVSSLLCKDKGVCKVNNCKYYVNIKKLKVAIYLALELINTQNYKQNTLNDPIKQKQRQIPNLNS